MTNKKAYTIIGAVGLSGFLVAAVQMFIVTKAELHAQALENAQAAIVLFESSKEEYCTVYRAYLSACAGKGGEQ